MGAIGGGPTFVGTLIGHSFTSAYLSVAFLTLAAGSIVYVVAQLFAVAAKAKRTDLLAAGLLLGAGPARLHVSYGGDAQDGWRLPEPPLALGARFTIEAVVRPLGDQGAWATLLGTQPGIARPPAGFTIQQDGPDGRRFVLLASDGRGFSPLAAWDLEPGRWNYLAAAVGSGTAAGLALQSGREVIEMGGFMGSDPAPSLAKLESLVHSGQLHYVLLSGGRGGGPGGGRSAATAARDAWVVAHGQALTVSGQTVYYLASNA